MNLNPYIIFRIMIFPGFLFLLLLTLFCDWFERKVIARMQNRMGPTYTGPWGILQPLADYIKLLVKEDITPSHVNEFVFTLTPIISFSLLMLSTFYLPIDGLNVFNNAGFEGDLILVLALITLSHFTLSLSGWSSSNPYSGVGAIRILTQFIGYDIPLMMLAIGPAIITGSLSISTIAIRQRIPTAILIPWVFLPYIITLQAELEEDPFDIPHAETEVVAGYGTEFTGRKFAFIRMSKDLQLLLGAALTASLFLGGPCWLIDLEFGGLLYLILFILKVLFVIFILELVEAVCARLRLDQVVRANWRLMVPMAASSLALTVVLAPFIRGLVGLG